MTGLYLGIDPGVTGGLALVDEHASILMLVNMPADDDRLLYATVCVPLLNYPLIPLHAVVEKVHASPQMGVGSAFTFGRQYGRVLMALAAANIAYEEVAPRIWQRALDCLTGGDKRVSRQMVTQLFPGCGCSSATADALLIAEYCRRSHVEAAP